MLRMSARRSIAKVLLSLTLLAGGAARAEDAEANKAAAREHYRAGERKFDVGKFDEAAVEFQTAYELTGSPVILYNIAKAYQLAQNPERALFFYRTYLRKMESPPNRAEVQTRINDLESVMKQSKHAADTPPPGILKPHDMVREPTKAHEPTKPPVNPETPPPTNPPPERQPPPQPETQITEPPPPQPDAVEPVATDPEPRRKLLKGLGFGLAGLAVVGAALGITFGVLAGQDSSAVQNGAATRQTFDQGFQSRQSNGQTFDSVQIAGYVVGGVAAAGAAVCLYFGLRPVKTERVSVAPFGSASNAGLAGSGKF